MNFDPQYRAELKQIIVNSLNKHKVNLKDKKAILQALPRVWADLEASGKLQDGMTYDGFEEQAHTAYEQSQFEEIFSSFFKK